ncbi:hypothetical protein FRC16_009506, partial [Serendipita sp. 398]
AFASSHHGEDGNYGDGDLIVQHVDESSQVLEAGHAPESFTAPGADGESKNHMNGDGSQTLAGHSPVAGRGPGGAGDKLSFDFDFLRLARDLFLKPIWFRTSRARYLGCNFSRFTTSIICV